MNELELSTFNRVVKAPLNLNDLKINVDDFPVKRYSTPQLLILDQGWQKNLVTILGCLVSLVDCKAETLSLVSDRPSDLIVFNPMHTRIHFSVVNDQLDYFLNIAEASVEIWKDNTKIDQLDLPAPRLFFIFAPTASSLLLAALIFNLVLFLRRGPLESEVSFRAVYCTSTKSLFILVILCFACGAGLIGWVHSEIFHRLPGFGDEMNYLAQARIFAAGHLAVSEPSLPTFFKVSWMDLFGSDHLIWDYHAIGNSLVLTLGWLVGCYWITVPLVAGALFVAQFFLARQILQSNLWAMAYVFALSSSHYIVTLAASFMAHATCLLFISIFLIFLLKYFTKRTLSALSVAAFFLGLAFITRPLSAILVAIVPLSIILVRTSPRKWLEFVPASFVFLLTCSTLFFYSYFISGEFTVPYLVKGPEVGKTILSRLSMGWDFRLKTLFRNWNELSMRLHSFGIFFNMAPFALALLAPIVNRRWGIISAGFFTFLVYVFGHSFLHWYGWKWEPRMLYEISFIPILAGIFGIKSLAETFDHPRWRQIGIIGPLMGVLCWAQFVDLPRRLYSEYAEYNKVHSELAKSIETAHIENAIVFLNGEMDYAPYSVFNSPAFNGSIIFAISQGQSANYALISRFPGRKIYYSTDGKSLIEQPNFLSTDLAQLVQSLATISGPKKYIVVPYAKYLSQDLKQDIPGQVMDDDELLNIIKDSVQRDYILTDSAIALVGSSVSWKPLLEGAYHIEGVTTNTSGSFQLLQLGAARREFVLALPGFKLACFKGRGWQSEPQKILFTLNIDQNDCAGTEVSAVWSSNILLSEAHILSISVESDDGAGVAIDGEMIVDNGLTFEHGRIKTVGQVSLMQGQHSIEVKYFNGPADGFLSVVVTVDNGLSYPLEVSEGLPFKLLVGKMDQ